MKPSEKTQRRIASSILLSGRIPPLDAYSWTLPQLLRLAEVARRYEKATHGTQAEGAAKLYEMIKHFQPRRLAKTGWSTRGEIRVTGIDIDRQRH
jgi:hypothetical protein